MGAGQGVGNAFLKIFSGILQFVFSIAALGLISYGAFASYFIFTSNSTEVVKQYLTPLPAIVTFALGILLLTFACVGCCGLCRESTCCMDTYSVILILMGLAHLALGAYSCIYFNDGENQYDIRTSIEKDMNKEVSTYSRNKEQIDLIQQWFSCCGSTDYMEDYKYYSYGENNLPISCCRNGDKCTKQSQDIMANGCSERVYLVTIFNNVLIGWISLAVGAAELIAALFGLCLSCCIWRSHNRSFR